MLNPNKIRIGRVLSRWIFTWDILLTCWGISGCVGVPLGGGGGGGVQYLVG